MSPYITIDSEWNGSKEKLGPYTLSEELVREGSEEIGDQDIYAMNTYPNMWIDRYKRPTITITLFVGNDIFKQEIHRRDIPFEYKGDGELDGDSYGGVTLHDIPGMYGKIAAMTVFWDWKQPDKNFFKTYPCIEKICLECIY